MRRVSGKNRLAIIALAVMIGVAGYMSFADAGKDKKTKKNGKEQVEVISYDEVAGSDTTLLGRPFTPVSTKFSINALATKMIYLNPLILLRFSTKESIFPSDFVSSVGRYSFQNESSRIMALISLISSPFFLKILAGISSKPKSE